MLAEASDELGGRVSRESRLPGLGIWSRVRDYRSYLLSQMANVEIYQSSRLTAAQILEFGATHVAIATGASWRGDGFGRHHQFPIAGIESTRVLTPDNIMAGVKPGGSVLVYDDDHYYMASVVAEQLVADGCQVYFATPGAVVASWSEHTLEQHHIQAGLLDLGVQVIVSHELKEVTRDSALLSCLYSGRAQVIEVTSVVMVTSRLPDDVLYHQLAGDGECMWDSGLKTLKPVGDCLGPATIAAAVYEGHRFARELGEEQAEIPFRRELTELTTDFKLP